MHLLEGFVPAQRIGDVPDGRDHRLDEPDPAGALLEIEATRVMADEVFDEWLRFGDAGLPVGRRLPDDLVVVLAVGTPDDPNVLELDPRVVGLELADAPSEGGHPERAGFLAGRV